MTIHFPLKWRCLFLAFIVTTAISSQGVAQDVNLERQPLEYVSRYSITRKIGNSANDNINISAEFSAKTSVEGDILVSAKCKSSAGSFSVENHGAFTIYTQNNIGFRPLVGGLFGGKDGFNSRLCFFVKNKKGQNQIKIECYNLITIGSIPPKLLRKINTVMLVYDSNAEEYIKSFSVPGILLLEAVGTATFDIRLTN